MSSGLGGSGYKINEKQTRLGISASCGVCSVSWGMNPDLTSRLDICMTGDRKGKLSVCIHKVHLRYKLSREYLPDSSQVQAVTFHLLFYSQHHTTITCAVHWPSSQSILRAEIVYLSHLYNNYCYLLSAYFVLGIEHFSTLFTLTRCRYFF